MKKCPACKQTKARSAFRPNKSRKDGLQTYCVECDRKRQKDWYMRNMAKAKMRTKEISARLVLEVRANLLAYFEQHPCVDCGEPDPVVLEFDHVRGAKKFTVSHMMRRRMAWETIRVEIAKCDVRCSNCHRRKTAKTFGWYKLVSDRASERTSLQN